MNASFVTMSGAAIALMVASTASADFAGISWELVDPVIEGWTGGDDGYDGSVLDTYRIYATFTDNNAAVTAVGDLLDSTLFSLTSGNGSFFNSTASGSSDLPPDPSSFTLPGGRDLQWDTFVAIGAAAESDPTTTLAPGFTEQAMGMTGDFRLDDTGWYVAGFPPQGNTVDNRVLIAQLTVAEGISIDGGNWLVSGLEEQGNFETAFNEFADFSIPGIPAPGAIALLGFAGLVVSRRHRGNAERIGTDRRRARLSRSSSQRPTA